MSMMLRCHVLIAVLFGFALLPASARAALVCDADIVTLDFGMISVRDGLPQKTSGQVTISCTGGIPLTTIQACVVIGSDSGGDCTGQSPRYMTGDGTAPLQYQLTTQNFSSSGGGTWETVQYSVPLGLTGRGTIAPTLYAEVTSIGALATTGLYGSSFCGRC